MIPAVGKVNVNHSFHVYPPLWSQIWLDEDKGQNMPKWHQVFLSRWRVLLMSWLAETWLPRVGLQKQFNMETKTNEYSLTFTTAFGALKLKDVQCACPMCTSKSVRKHHRSSRVGAIGALPSTLGSCSWFAGLAYPEPIWKIVIQSGCTCFHTVFSLWWWCSMFASFDNSINDLWWSMDSGQDTCILFKVRRLGSISYHASSREAFVWQMVFLTLPANDCTVAACKLLHFTVFNVLSGGDQPRPDDPHPFFAWGTSGASRRWSQLRLFQRGNGGWASRDSLKNSLGSVKRGAEQIRFFSTEAFHLPMSMSFTSFTRCSSLHRVLFSG